MMRAVSGAVIFTDASCCDGVVIFTDASCCDGVSADGFVIPRPCSHTSNAISSRVTSLKAF